jgi:hypothetical protein
MSPLLAKLVESLLREGFPTLAFLGALYWLILWGVLYHTSLGYVRESNARKAALAAVCIVVGQSIAGFLQLAGLNAVICTLLSACVYWGAILNFRCDPGTTTLMFIEVMVKLVIVGIIALLPFVLFILLLFL